MTDTPRTKAIVDCFRQSFNESDHERSHALREAAEIALEDLERELTTAQARIAELEKDKADFHMQYRMKCDEETKRLELRIALLESGQPCEVRGEMWQLVPVEPSSAMLRPSDDWCDRTVNWAIYAAMLTASAQEAQKGKT